jgi:NAD(P)H-dependent flavin oxidoreductase YrpB (nitropropane dioxygenase family)
MLKINFCETPAEERWILHGRLTDPWVHELSACWKKNHRVAVLPYPLQRALMRNLAVPAQQAGRSEFLALWAGQSAGIAQYPDVATLLQSLVNGVSEKLA